MARGTIMSGILLLLTVSSVILSANAKSPTILDRARKLIDINGFDVSSLMGGLQNSEGGDSPDLEDVAKNAPALMAMAGIQGDSANSPISISQEDVAKNAPAILVGLQTLQQNNADSPPEDSESNLFEGLDNFRDSLNKKPSAPAAAPSPAKGQQATSAPSPAKGQQATLAPSPQVSKSAQSPSQPAAGPARSTIAMGPSAGIGRGAGFGNGHIAVSPASTVDRDVDDVARAPIPGNGRGSGY